MRLLLDTHVVLWALNDSEKLGRDARLILESRANEVIVSVASLWEIAVKNRIGKLPDDLRKILPGLATAGYRILSIEVRHIEALGALPMHHRDPFDHLLLAQALADRLTLMTRDAAMRRYGVPLVPAER